mmetsp:Transcript_38293/g.113513  ORF Transcript_38293/g.113513 Transcript_38293/m.113513 type:complete len:289 (+) Transcript_38293:1855-2721(+)
MTATAPFSRISRPNSYPTHMSSLSAASEKPLHSPSATPAAASSSTVPLSSSTARLRGLTKADTRSEEQPRRSKAALSRYTCTGTLSTGNASRTFSISHSTRSSLPCSRPSTAASARGSCTPGGVEFGCPATADDEARRLGTADHEAKSPPSDDDGAGWSSTDDAAVGSPNPSADKDDAGEGCCICRGGPSDDGPASLPQAGRPRVRRRRWPRSKRVTGTCATGMSPWRPSHGVVLPRLKQRLWKTPRAAFALACAGLRRTMRSQAPPCAVAWTPSAMVHAPCVAVRHP